MPNCNNKIIKLYIPNSVISPGGVKASSIQLRIGGGQCCTQSNIVNVAISNTQESPSCCISATNLFRQYTLANTLNDTLGGPSLVSNGGNLNSDGYTINSANQGLSLSNPLGSTSIINYVIKMRIKFNSIPAVWGKILDFKNRSSDSGLYIRGGKLTFYPSSTAGSMIFNTTQFYDILLIRNNNILYGCVDGVNQFSYNDTTSLGIFDANNILQIGIDDLQVSGETTLFTISSLEIYTIDSQGLCLPTPTPTPTQTPSPSIFSLNTANYNLCADWNGQDGNVTTVGSNGGPSAYGTYDQSGNVWEWHGGGFLRGGAWFIEDPGLLSKNSIGSNSPWTEGDSFGFRIASSSSVLNPLNLPYFVNVGDVNNAADTNGYGEVNYIYQIAQYLVTNCEYAEFLNAVASADQYGLYNVWMSSDPRAGISRSGSSGNYIYSVKTNMGNKPINYISWFDAARYCNWLHNGKGNGSTENGAYTLNGATTGNTVAKNVNASYSMPTENEWYKAAYYKGGGTNAGYWLYATQSNSDPTCASADMNGNGPINSNYSCSTLCCSISNNLLTNSTFDTTSGWQFVNVDRYRLGDYLVGGDLTNYIIDLNALSPGYIEQTVPGLINGSQYCVRFDLSANLAGGPRYRTMRLTLYDDLGYNVSQNYTFDTNGLTYSGTMESQGWQTKVFTFTAPGTSLFKIKLESTCPECINYGPLVDNVMLCGA